MSVVIRAEALSKSFTIAAARRRHDTLRDQIAEGVKSFVRRRSAPISCEHHLGTAGRLFEVKRGEILGLSDGTAPGRARCQNTRITEPSAGRAEIRGRVGSLLEVGTGFDRELTGRENVI
jgi:lipopolysaccharide transport system ATP-binding protein